MIIVGMDSMNINRKGRFGRKIRVSVEFFREEIGRKFWREAQRREKMAEMKP